MLVAFVNGCLGVVLTIWVGTSRLGMSLDDCIRAAVIAFFAGFACTLVTTRAEAQPWIKKHILNRSITTWMLHAGVFFGILFGGIPALRDGRAFLWLILPLILCTGFSIIVFGPIQDQFVRRAQRRALPR